MLSIFSLSSSLLKKKKKTRAQMLLVMIFEPQGKSPLSGDLAAVGSILG